ncbi:hypothetical protein B484DRAFT_402614 [Ochromonadaceae sp. CCMP2298]|nr:hypothetical protein B484DRAFT_402614 [Ochromonadaceae sp. CCMP2298]
MLALGGTLSTSCLGSQSSSASSACSSSLHTERAARLPRYNITHSHHMEQSSVCSGLCMGLGVGRWGSAGVGGGIGVSAGPMVWVRALLLLQSSEAWERPVR